MHSESDTLSLEFFHGNIYKISDNYLTHFGGPEKFAKGEKLSFYLFTALCKSLFETSFALFPTVLVVKMEITI